MSDEIIDFSKLDCISFSRDGFKPHVKSPIIWGVKGCKQFPLCYLTKPKSLNEKDWDAFLDRFDFQVKKEPIDNK